MTNDALESSLKGGMASESLNGADWLSFSIKVTPQPEVSDAIAANPIDKSMHRPVVIHLGRSQFEILIDYSIALAKCRC
jgi:hypothetical protein